MEITEEQNTKMPRFEPIKEIMNIHIPDIIDGIPNRNGFIWVITGSGGSGKTSMLLNFFKSKQLYKHKFSNLFYICPQSSYLSVANHPFEKHDSSRIFHELNEDILDDIYSELKEIKKENVEADKEDYQYNCVIIDDMADALKQPDIQKKLSQMLIKARHLSCAFIFTLQSYHYFPKLLRKQITNITIFKPKNNEEMESIAKELLHMKKDDSLKLYEYIFNVPYNHLDIDTLNDTLYRNFNKLEIRRSAGDRRN
jgi:KaiC/GvpD/RAD55 family RecA-like ATPase